MSKKKVKGEAAQTIKERLDKIEELYGHFQHAYFEQLKNMGDNRNMIQGVTVDLHALLAVLERRLDGFKEEVTKEVESLYEQLTKKGTEKGEQPQADDTVDNRETESSSDNSDQDS